MDSAGHGVGGRQLRESRHLRVAFTLSVVAATMLVSTLHWGKGQEFDYEFLRRHSKVGMTLDKVCWWYALDSLDFAPGSPHRADYPDGGWMATIAEPGIGKWFVPQKAVKLLFDERDTLIGIECWSHYRLRKLHVGDPRNSSSFIGD